MWVLYIILKKKQDINQIKQREEYVLFKEIVSLNFTEDSNSGNTIDSKNTVNTVIEGSGVNPSFCTANVAIDTSNNKRSFLAPLDILFPDLLLTHIPYHCFSSPGFLLLPARYCQTNTIFHCGNMRKQQLKDYEADNNLRR